jgi:hypothetical protein
MFVMKKILIAALVIPALAFTCKKQGSTGWLEGKVLRVSCASTVVQVLNNDAIGQDGWKDMTNNNATYDNVFTANNKCSIPSAIKAGTTIRFKIDKPAPNECVVCMMYDGPPEIAYDMKEVTVTDAK